MPIIHVKISHNSEILKDWEGLPVEKEMKIKDFFRDTVRPLYSHII